MAMATYFFLSMFDSFVGLRELELVEEKSLNLKWLFSQFKLAGGWLATTWLAGSALAPASQFKPAEQVACVRWR